MVVVSFSLHACQVSAATTVHTPFLFFSFSSLRPSMLFVRPTDSFRLATVALVKRYTSSPYAASSVASVDCFQSLVSLSFFLLPCAPDPRPRPLLSCFPCRRVVVLQMNGFTLQTREALSPVAFNCAIESPLSSVSPSFSRCAQHVEIRVFARHCQLRTLVSVSWLNGLAKQGACSQDTGADVFETPDVPPEISYSVSQPRPCLQRPVWMS